MQKYPKNSHNAIYRATRKCLCLATVLLLGLCLGIPELLAQNSNARSLILSDSYSEHYLAPYVICHKDKTNTKTAQDIISSETDKKRLSDFSGSIAALGTSNETIWMTFNIMNRSTTTDWKIGFGNNFMGRFGLLENIKSYTYDVKSESFTENILNGDNSIDLSLPIDERSQILLQLKLTQGVPTTIPLRLLKANKKTTLQDNATQLICILLLVGMGFFFAAIALMKSTYHYLYFSAYYILLTALLVIQNDFVVVKTYLIGSEILPFLLLLITLSGFMIGRLFWDMEDSSRFANIAFFSFIGFSFFSFMGGFILPLDMPIIKSALLFGPSLLTLILIPLISIAQSQQGNNEATPFMFGWFILLFGASISALALSGIMPPVPAAINAYWYTLIPQTIFFIFATKMKLNTEAADTTLSKTVEISETDSISRLRKSKENTEQDRLLKVIEQERKVLGELRKSEARRTEEMRKAKDEADHANTAKSAFLAVVSHEIRTPMTGIMGMVRLLLDSNLTKDQKEYARTIQDSSDAMLALLNDILDFEKIEQGKMNFENIDFDIHRLVNGVATLMNGHAAQKNIALKTKIGSTLPRYVKGDPTRLRQVLLNLTGNAVKFTDKGHVTLTAELMKRKEDNNFEIYFSVSDSGIGISKEAQKDLFTPFSQADSSISRKFGGTGLGLAISKGLIEAMGSAININSNEGEGSTFFFTLNMPAGQGSGATSSTEDSQVTEAAKPLKILLVDDNDVNQKVVKGFLEKTSHTLTMANTAEEALQKIEGHDFDLVLMDIELPGMKGDQATQKLRNSDKEKMKNLPVIALTGNTMPQDIERFYKAGMNDFIAKPIDPDKLKTSISKAGQGVFENPKMAVSPITQEIKTDKTPIATDEPSDTAKAEENERTEIAVEKKDNVEVFNPKTLETLKGHISKSDIQEMLNDVTVKNEEIITSLKEAITKDDKETIAAKGHELKGMAGNFGLVELSEQAGLIEIKAKTAATIILTSLVEPLPEMQKRAKEALDHWINDIKD